MSAEADLFRGLGFAVVGAEVVEEQVLSMASIRNSACPRIAPPTKGQPIRGLPTPSISRTMLLGDGGEDGSSPPDLPPGILNQLLYACQDAIDELEDRLLDAEAGPTDELRKLRLKEQVGRRVRRGGGAVERGTRRGSWAGGGSAPAT